MRRTGVESAGLTAGRPRARCAGCEVLGLAAGLAVSLSATGVHAQDSVSSAPGLPGDAVSAYQAGVGSEQVNDYVVDLAPKTGSWGSRYVLGPVVKTSRASSPAYFDLLMGAQGASARFLSGPLLRAAYTRWTTPGQGVNAAANSAPSSTVTTAGLSGQQFAVGFMEYGSGPDGVFDTSDDENNIVGAVVGFQRRAPSRLYISRIVGATNKPAAAGASTAWLGLGGVDAAGNMHAYLDHTSAQDTNRFYARIAAAARNGAAVNQLSDAAATDGPSTSFVRSSVTSMTTPAIIPADLGPGRPVVVGLDLNSNYIFESAANSTQTTKNYLPGASGSSRGNLTFIAQPFAGVAPGGTEAGTGACLVRTDGGSRTRGIQLFGINPNGGATSNLQIQLPANGAQMTDPTDGWSPQGNFGSASTHEFTSYASQVPFRGGNGQIAGVVLPSEDLLVAAVVTTSAGATVPQQQDNYLVVATVTPLGETTWVTAAHTGNPMGAAGGLSKVILGDNGADGAPGTGDAGEGDGVVDTGPSAWIGRLARIGEVFPGQTAGPSISAPAMDRRGNLYFMATMALKQTGGGLEYTSGLIRGVRDDATGGYRLELVARLGDIMPGLNSGRNYQIQFMGIADADSASSGGLWSGNIVQDSLPGVDASAAPYASPLGLGALVFRAKIVYDFNGDGLYADPSASGGSGSPDQAYNVAMLLMPQILTGDFNLDGTVSVQDIFDFLAAYFGGIGDWNGDGVTSVQDIFDFLSDFFGG